MPTRPRSFDWTALAPAAAVAVYLLLVVPSVDRQGINWDEHTDLTVAAAYLDEVGLWAGSSGDLNQTRLPMYLGGLLFRAAGDVTLHGARLLSCAVGVLTLLGVWVFCRRELSRDVGRDRMPAARNQPLLPRLFSARVHRERCLRHLRHRLVARRRVRTRAPPLHRSCRAARSRARARTLGEALGVADPRRGAAARVPHAATRTSLRRLAERGEQWPALRSGGSTRCLGADLARAGEVRPPDAGQRRGAAGAGSDGRGLDDAPRVGLAEPEPPPQPAADDARAAGGRDRDLLRRPARPHHQPAHRRDDPPGDHRGRRRRDAEPATRGCGVPLPGRADQTERAGRSGAVALGRSGGATCDRKLERGAPPPAARARVLPGVPDDAPPGRRLVT